MSSSVTPYSTRDAEFGELNIETAASLLAASGDIAVVIDRAGVIRDVSLGGAEASFDATSQWVGRPWVETVTPESRTKIDTLMKEALATGMSKRRQVNTVLADGVDVPVAYTALRVGRDGNVVAVGRDMRHVSALQQRLVESQQAMERDYWRLRHVETRRRGVRRRRRSTHRPCVPFRDRDRGRPEVGRVDDDGAKRRAGRRHPRWLGV